MNQVNMIIAPKYSRKDTLNNEINPSGPTNSGKNNK